MNQHQKAALFRSLHERDGAFIIPNPWDVGSARLLAQLGFEALATTSTGFAFSLGLREDSVSQQQVLQHCDAIVNASDLPVSADLEKGFGDSPETVADTIRLAAATGLAGCSIEDFSGHPEHPIYDFNLAVERIQAAIEAKNALAHDFVFTARCENYLWNRADLDDTINRLQAFEQAGADVLYAPGLPDIESIATVCASLKKPLNVVIESTRSSLNLVDLAEVGVKRVSVGSSLFLASFGRLISAAKEMQTRGTFEFSADIVSFAEVDAIMAEFESTR